MAKNKKPPSAAQKPPNIPPPASANENKQARISPWDPNDKYPTVIGSQLTLAYISAVFRTAQTGYRREFVDVLDELVERDAHAYACLSQRFFTVAGARLAIHPAKCEPADEQLAKDIALEIEGVFHQLPQRRQAFSSLLWGNFYGVSVSEIGWDVDQESGKWTPSRLYWVHSRRLVYPDPFSWNLRIWDLGMVTGWNQFAPKGADSILGLSPSDFPGKFIVHEPQLRGDYPTRDGIGREIAYWMAIKLMAARSLGQYIERFGKPWPVGYYSTTKEQHPRAATEDDIKALETALLGLGGGSNGGAAALPDSVKVALDGPTSGSLPTELPQAALIRICNAEISKAVLGNSDTIEAGPNGSRGAVEIRNQSTLEIYRYDSACLCDTLKRDLVWWYVHLNYPGKEHLCPTPHLDVEPPPDRATEAKIILDMVQAGAPIDADHAAKQTGVTLIPSNNEEPRRLGYCMPVHPSVFDPNIEPPAPPPAPGEPPSEGDKDPEDTTDKPAEKPAKKAAKKPAKLPKEKL